MNLPLCVLCFCVHVKCNIRITSCAENKISRFVIEFTVTVQQYNHDCKIHVFLMKQLISQIWQLQSIKFKVLSVVKHMTDIQLVNENVNFSS